MNLHKVRVKKIFLFRHDWSGLKWLHVDLKTVKHDDLKSKDKLIDGEQGKDLTSR